MIFSENIKVKRVYLDNPSERRMLEDFLLSQGLALERDIEYAIGLYKEDNIIGTGSIAGNVIKSIAIDPNYQGQGLANKILSILINEQHYRGNTHIFIYTKPENVNKFCYMGFYEIQTIKGQVALLENDPKGINRFIDNLKKYKKDGKIISSIVMNSNPFTLGHQHLIQKASIDSDFVHIFIVWEDKSIFPPDARFNLVKEGTKHLSNVIVHKGKNYIISNSTFPSYFLNEKSNIVKIHASLDLNIFGNYICPALGINRRYIGDEPYCSVTREYNKIMKSILPKYNIEVIEIPRFKKDNIGISASRVRELIRKRKLEELKNLIPKVTYDFLISDEGKIIAEKIRESNTRH